MDLTVSLCAVQVAGVFVARFPPRGALDKLVFVGTGHMSKFPTTWTEMYLRDLEPRCKAAKKRLVTNRRGQPGAGRALRDGLSRGKDQKKSYNGKQG